MECFRLFLLSMLVSVIMKRFNGIVLFIILIIFITFTEKRIMLLYSPLINVKRKAENISVVQTRNHSSSTQETQVKLHNLTDRIAYKPTLLNRDRKFCIQMLDDDPFEVPPEWENRCPQKPVVTVMQYGRLGNQIWEYVSVWTLAKITGREPFVPSCIIQTLKGVFKNLTAVLPLKYIENCPIRYNYLFNAVNIEKQEGDIVLPFLAQLPQYVVPHLKEIVQLLQFHDHLTQTSQDILRREAKGVRDIVFVSVHVRRTDYKFLMLFLFNRSLVTADFFLRQMNYFRKKYSRVLFVILSEDPDWCDRELSANDTVVVRGNSPEQDLSLLASCNHSILDYGTYGMWGAMIAGGETRLYTAPMGLEEQMVKWMPNWYSVT